MSLASAAPSKMRIRVEAAERLRVSTESTPSSTSCWRVRAMVAKLVSRAFAIWLALQASPSSPRQPSTVSTRKYPLGAYTSKLAAVCICDFPKDIDIAWKARPTPHAERLAGVGPVTSIFRHVPSGVFRAIRRRYVAGIRHAEPVAEVVAVEDATGSIHRTTTVRPEVHEVTTTSEVTGELMATGKLMAMGELMAARELMAAHHTAHVAAETAPVAAASPTSAGKRGRRERQA
jgi:hypothetical protein